MPAPTSIVVTNQGKAMAARALKGAGYNPPNEVWWGVGTGVAAATDVGLFTIDPQYDGASIGVMSLVTTSVTNDTFRVDGAFTPITVTPKAVTEVIVDDGGTNTLMHAVFPAINLAVGDAIAIAVEVQFT